MSGSYEPDALYTKTYHFCMGRNGNHRKRRAFLTISYYKLIVIKSERIAFLLIIFYIFKSVENLYFCLFLSST